MRMCFHEQPAALGTSFLFIVVRFVNKTKLDKLNFELCNIANILAKTFQLIYATTYDFRNPKKNSVKLNAQKLNVTDAISSLKELNQIKISTKSGVMRCILLSEIVFPPICLSL